jgi:hypothetical protein
MLGWNPLTKSRSGNRELGSHGVGRTIECSTHLMTVADISRQR